MKKAVITGADGFLGSHLTKYFASNGYTVFAVVLCNSPTRSRVAGLENTVVVPFDSLHDFEKIVPMLPMRPDVFIHLAWAGVSHESRDVIDIQFGNIDLSICAVKLAARIEAQRFILPGSTMEYMYSGGLINQNTLPSPQNAYGAAKISSRYICGSLCFDLGIPFIYVVIAGIYSADRIDNNVIYYAVSTLLKGERPSFTKLEQLWDYVYIDDVVYAMLLIAQKGKPDAFYSIGHGDNWPLYNYIYMIRDAIDPNLELGIGEIPYKMNLMPSSCVDLTSLKNDTGYEPQVPFEVGIRKVIAVVRNSI